MGGAKKRQRSNPPEKVEKLRSKERAEKNKEKENKEKEKERDAKDREKDTREAKLLSGKEVGDSVGEKVDTLMGMLSEREAEEMTITGTAPPPNSAPLTSSTEIASSSSAAAPAPTPSASRLSREQKIKELRAKHLPEGTGGRKGRSVSPSSNNPGGPSSNNPGGQHARVILNAGRVPLGAANSKEAREQHLQEDDIAAKMESIKRASRETAHAAWLKRKKKEEAAQSKKEAAQSARATSQGRTGTATTNSARAAVSAREEVAPGSANSTTRSLRAGAGRAMPPNASLKQEAAVFLENSKIPVDPALSPLKRATITGSNFTNSNVHGLKPPGRWVNHPCAGTNAATAAFGGLATTNIGGARERKISPYGANRRARSTEKDFNEKIQAGRKRPGSQNRVRETSEERVRRLLERTVLFH